MKLVEKHIIKKTDKRFKILDEYAFLSKNLYNASIYAIKEHHKKEQKFLNYSALCKKFQEEKNPDYYALNTKISQWVLKQVSTAFESFFKALKDYHKNPSKYKAMPKPPFYKNKKRGRNLLICTIQTIGRKKFKEKILSLFSGKFELKTQIKPIYQKKSPFHQEKSNIAQVRIIPKRFSYQIEIVYEKEIEKLDLDKKKIAAIDLGITNLATVVFNDFSLKPFSINGKPLQQINHYYHKIKAKNQSLLPKGRYSSHAIRKLTEKRNHKIRDYLHKASRLIINELAKNKISKLIIGYNKLWKDSVDLGKIFNQKFVQIPFTEFLNQLKYKSELLGIEIQIQEESYTSKCSFLDNEKISKQVKYKGKRIKRGLFRSSEGILLNADVNAAYNILRKAIPKAFGNGIQDVVVHPYRYKCL